MKVYVLGMAPAYVAMFERQEGFKVVNSLNQADAVQFTGGEDVTPSLYNELRHPRTYNNEARDKIESDVFETCLGKKHMLGICRGSQFLNVMNGGRTYQDVNNHAISGTHACFSELLGTHVEVTSTHHQIMRPHKRGEVDGWAWKLATRKEHMDYEGNITTALNDPKDIEAVFYEDTRCLCFQPHPEFAGAHSTRDYYFSLINHFLV
tara:strand:+ start:3060 stop:3680 length:621 start_codon:yes stop_codon:yes gene_type:complete